MEKNVQEIKQSSNIHRFPLPELVRHIDWVEQSLATRNLLGELVWPGRVYTSDALSEYADVLVVDETQNPVGGFKIRNALAGVIHSLEREVGHFVTGSAGTYGRSLAESVRGVPNTSAVVHVPTCTRSSSVADLRQLGAEVIVAGTSVDESINHAQQYAKKTGFKFLHPFANIQSILGASTIAWDIANNVPDATHVVLPYGGGSLAAGVGAVLKELKPAVEIVAVQVTKNTPFVDSVLTGHVQVAPDLDTRFGGIAVKNVHPLNLALASQAVSRALTLPGDYLYDTLHLLSAKNEMGKVLEEAGVASPAGARFLASLPEFAGAKIVALATGANPGPDTAHYAAAVHNRLTASSRA